MLKQQFLLAQNRLFYLQSLLYFLCYYSFIILQIITKRFD